MKVLRYLALIFMNAFGITDPSTETRDHAAGYIAFLMTLLVVTLFVCSFWF